MKLQDLTDRELLVLRMGVNIGLGLPDIQTDPWVKFVYPIRDTDDRIVDYVEYTLTDNDRLMCLDALKRFGLLNTSAPQSSLEDNNLETQ